MPHSNGSQAKKVRNHWAKSPDNQTAWIFPLTSFIHPLLNGLFLTTVCLCLLQSIVGVAGGATRAALTVHQARRDNMADISAKDGSQVLLLILSDL